MGLRTVTKRVVQLAWLFTLGGVLSYAFHAADGDPSQFGAATYAGSWLFCAIVLTVLYWAVVVPISWIGSRSKDEPPGHPPPDP